VSHMVMNDETHWVKFCFGLTDIGNHSDYIDLNYICME